MQILEYLRKQGYKTIDNGFYGAIAGWDSWYQSNVKSFHNYKIYNGRKHVKKTRKTLAMAKKVSEDIASLLMNEKVVITVDDNASQKFIDEVFKNNNFEVMGNTAQEWKAALGTVAYVPYMEGLFLDKGEVQGGKVSINFVPGTNVFPLSWKNCTVTECAFSIETTSGQDTYTHLQLHVLENGTYVIENKLFKTTNAKFEEVPLNSLRGYENVAPRVETGSAEPQFVIDRLNIVNNYDKLSPLGVPIFANSIDVLKGLDFIYDSYCTEFDIGRKRIFVRPELMSMSEDGMTGFDLDSESFYLLPDESPRDGDPFLKEVNMELRAEAHSKAVNDFLNLLSSKIGFGTGYYKFEKGTIQTATQVISEDSDMFRTVTKHEIILRDVLYNLIRIILKMGRDYLGRKDLNPDAEVIIDFDDSIIEDKQAEFNRDTVLLSTGVMRKDEMRAKYMNESIDEAKKNLEKEPEEVDSEE